MQALRSKLKTVLPVLVLAISSLCSAVSGSFPGSESAFSLLSLSQNRLTPEAEKMQEKMFSILIITNMFTLHLLN